jgi:hypothetical protein
VLQWPDAYPSFADNSVVSAVRKTTDISAWEQCDSGFLRINGGKRMEEKATTKETGEEEGSTLLENR